MPDDTNGSEPEKLLMNLRELNTLREELLRRQAAIGERHAASQRDLTRVVAEMKVLGTSPQTIQADLAKAREDVRKRVAEHEAVLLQLKTRFDETDRLLLALDQKR
jgi:hypothetical protein